MINFLKPCEIEIPRLIEDYPSPVTVKHSFVSKNIINPSARHGSRLSRNNIRDQAGMRK